MIEPSYTKENTAFENNMVLSNFLNVKKKKIHENIIYTL